MSRTHAIGIGQELNSLDVSYGPPFERCGGLVRASFIERPNRFLAVARLEEEWGELPRGTVVRAHVADPGRLRELLIPGVGVWLTPAPTTSTERRTLLDLVIVEHSGILVSIDSRVPNKLIGAALRAGAFPELGGVDGRHNRRSVRPEYTWGNSRFDFCLAVEGQADTLIEVKSASLVVNRTALFPDAPTERGARHVRELAEATRQGLRAVVVFVVQRSDADAFAPHAEMDRPFADAVHEAVRAGVAMKAVRCDVREDGISIAGEIEVRV
jgi:sugar fermentation stimulation protein A